MARIESVSIGGYYATPPRVVQLLASILEVEPDEHCSYLDPCAGDGEAVLTLMRTLHNDVSRNPTLFSVELEKSRYEALAEAVAQVSWVCKSQALHGDAFRVRFEPASGVHVLFLNPPYDFDAVHGRLEERFLERFTPALSAGGLLIFLVPFYALSASARTLGLHYTDVRCFRFPEPEFAAFKQVALIARRRDEALFEPDAEIVDLVKHWAADPANCEVLETGVAKIRVPHSDRWISTPFSVWKMAPVDLVSLLATVEPWAMTDRSGKLQRIPGILPEGPIEDMLVRSFTVAMPPRSAHIAAGIAAGIFNGARIEPDKPDSPLPPLLVKGVFDKEFRTVEEKTDKDGNVKGVVQVQQPKLVTTVLDLRTSRYVTIQPSAEVTGAKDIDAMTMADLLAEYGHGLMRVMLKQCPVLHDPARQSDHLELPEVARPLYTAQSHATQAAIKLLGGLGAPKRERRFKSAFVLGEIGSGKTSVALAVSHALKCKRTLVLCPPHLLQSWCDQIAAVVPWVRTLILSDIADVQRLADDADERPLIAILSRETAKLGHGIASVSDSCPGCGSEVDQSVDHAKKRSRCQGRQLLPKDPSGQAVLELALALVSVFPRDTTISQLLRTKPLRALISRKRDQLEPGESGFSQEAWNQAKARFEPLIFTWLKDDREAAWKAVLALLVANPDRGLVLRVARWLAAHEQAERARAALLLLSDGPDLAELVSEMRTEEEKVEKPSYYCDPWNDWTRKRQHLWHNGERVWVHSFMEFTRDDDGKVEWSGNAIGDPEAALKAISALAQQTFVRGPVCNEPLFQALPEPRRYPVATFIARKYPRLFDLLILDEGHEYATDGSAQERSAHRLTALGLPTLLLTGTVMNGYAESLFTNMWALSADFRSEFDRDERSRFVDRYGYRKRLVEHRDKEDGTIVAYGAMTDRVERDERVIGNAPGVLPIFLLRHLLPQAVTLHKTDLAVDIPSCFEIVTTVEPEQELRRRYESLKKTLLQRIKHDRFEKELAGKLWGALADLPSYLDLATADTGNREGGSYVIRYPESVGGEIVAQAEPFPASTILPKEAWMLAHVQRALGDGRNVLVFAWHTALLPRLARLLEEHLDMKCPVLDPAKVPTKKRQAWIDSQVVAKRRRVLIVNPVAVQTGLNNLVYFSDEVWMENPACNPTVYRQAVGRVDRIGQTAQTKILFPLYEGTSQQALHSLLMQKVAVSMSTDGLDAEGALRAAGVGDDTGFSSFAVGRQLYEMLTSSKSGRPRSQSLAAAE